MLASILTLALLSACGGQKIVAKTPGIKAFSINNVSVQDNFGFIVTSPQDIVLRAEAEVRQDLKRLTIYIKKDAGDYSSLAECNKASCDYLWSVSSASNGVYSFLIEAEDSRGALSALPFKNALAVSIR